MKSRTSIGVLALLVLAGGCDRLSPSTATAARERADRASASYQLAMTDLQAGRLDEAVAGFRRVLADEPANANAHFQLATILEDYQKKHVDALAHLKIYLALRPNADKAPVAETLAQRCETLFAAEAVEKAGVESKLAQELEHVKKERAELAKKLAECTTALEAAQKANLTLSQELEGKKRVFSGLVASETGSTNPPSRIARRPTDADLLDEEGDTRRLNISEVKALLAQIDAEDRQDSGAKDKREGEVEQLRRQIADEDRLDAANPLSAKTAAPTNAVASTPLFGGKKKKPDANIPKTYVVEDGDTLMGIAAKFYGDKRKWRAIREANMTTISADGRVNAGVEIKLP